MPFAPGTEVMVHAFIGYALGRVVGCDGPDAISLDASSVSRTKRFDELMPVVRMPAEYVFGAQVFARGADGTWIRAWIVRGPHEGDWTVRDQWGRDPLFDRSVSEDSLRIALLPKDRHRHRRSLGEAVEALAKKVLWGLLCAIVLGFAWVLVSRLW